MCSIIRQLIIRTCRSRDDHCDMYALKGGCIQVEPETTRMSDLLNNLWAAASRFSNTSDAVSGKTTTSSAGKSPGLAAFIERYQLLL